MREYMIKLKPRSGLEGDLSSSTLFGAICWSLRMLYGEKTLTETILADFNTRPFFIASNPFPFKMLNKETVYYLPKPIYPPLSHETIINLADELNIAPPAKAYHSEKRGLVWLIQQYKNFKKQIRWIDMDSFRLLIQEGANGERTLFRLYLRKILTPPRWRHKVGVQKNSLDRLINSTGGAGNTFYHAESFAQAGFGLYFLLQTEHEDMLKAALRLIADSGIGPNTRTGKNHFKIRWRSAEFSDTQTGPTFITLAPYIQREPFDPNGSYYEIDFKRHKVASREEFSNANIWKNALPFIREGSIITLNEKKQYPGEIIPVKKLNGKTIYQYGMAYPYWMNSDTEKKDAISN